MQFARISKAALSIRTIILSLSSQSDDSSFPAYLSHYRSKNRRNGKKNKKESEENRKKQRGEKMKPANPQKKRIHLRSIHRKYGNCRGYE